MSFYTATPKQLRAAEHLSFMPLSVLISEKSKISVLLSSLYFLVSNLISLIFIGIIIFILYNQNKDFRMWMDKSVEDVKSSESKSFKTKIAIKASI